MTARQDLQVPKLDQLDQGRGKSECDWTCCWTMTLLCALRYVLFHLICCGKALQAENIQLYSVYAICHAQLCALGPPPIFCVMSCLQVCTFEVTVMRDRTLDRKTTVSSCGSDLLSSFCFGYMYPFYHSQILYVSDTGYRMLNTMDVDLVWFTGNDTVHLTSSHQAPTSPYSLAFSSPISVPQSALVRSQQIFFP
jgi:hypothetical protein